MRKTYLIDPPRAIIFGVTAAFFIVLSVSVLSAGYIYAGAVIGVLAIIYTAVFIKHMALLTIYEDRLVHSYFGLMPKTLERGAIAEVWLCGSRVLNRKPGGRSGTLYICFSEKSLSDGERLKLTFEGLSGICFYLRYSKARMAAVRDFWKSSITLWNIGDMADKI